jgi:hypothetical protein
VPINDRREIAFDAAAMVVVIKSSRRMVLAIGLPDVAPVDVRFDPDASEVALLYSIIGRAIPIQQGPLSALLISYCMRTGIRVPRLLNRSVRVDRDAVVLVFCANHPVPPTTLAPERTKEVAPARSLSWLETPPATAKRPITPPPML